MSKYTKIKVLPQSVDICPNCGGTKVGTYDSRDYGFRLKRRKCFECSYRYSTLEVLVDDWQKYTENDDMYALGYDEGVKETEETYGKAVDKLVKNVEVLLRNGKKGSR